MTRRFGVNQLVGEFFRHARHEIAMFTKKRNMLVVGRRLHRVDLDGIGTPVFEKRPKRFDRQRAGPQLLHEG